MTTGSEMSPLETARTHSELGLPLGRSTRFRFVKRVIYRVAWLFLNHQVAVNHGLVDALTAAEARLNRLEAEMAELSQTTTDRLDLGLRQAYAEIADHVARAAVDQGRLALELQALAAQIHSLAPLPEIVDGIQQTMHDESSRMHLARVRANAAVERLRRLSPQPIELPPSQQEVHPPQQTSSWDDLYLSFEDEFRGSQDEIKKRLSVYLADLETVERADYPVLDIGCGRGDWLELLAEHKTAAYGIDLNQQSVERARARGLDARLGDALAHLEELPIASVAAVTAFHIVEHLTVEQLITLLDHAFRVLTPDGLLILETPNPNNLAVGISNFYLDPTHRNPLPPPLLAFLVASSGFVDPEIRQLSREPFSKAPDAAWASLHPALLPLLIRLQEYFVAGADYAVIARRS